MQASGGKITVDKPVVTAGGDFTISGTPGLEISIDSASQDGPTVVKLDANGEARIQTTPPPRRLSIIVADDPDSSAEVQIIDPS